MNDLSRHGAARLPTSFLPGVIYEWTPAGASPAGPIEDIDYFQIKADTILPAPGIEAIEGYRLEEQVGIGCTGQVWRADGPGGVGVAFKFVEHGQRGSTQELRSLALMPRIRHANLVTIFGIWDRAEWSAIGMDLADGSLLGQLDAAVSPPAAQAVGLRFDVLIDYLRQAARGIDFLNEPRSTQPGQAPQRLVHRDIKPANLLLVGGSVKVGDFGLVAPLGVDEVRGRIEGGDAIESLVTAYSSPEVRQGEYSSRSDQYSLAATYCHLRGGRVPATPLNGAGPPDLTMIPPAEHAAVARALATDPADRWPDCASFVEALANSGAHPRPEPATRTRIQKPRWIVAASVGLSGLFVAGLAVWTQGRDEPSAVVQDRPAPIVNDFPPRVTQPAEVDQPPIVRMPAIDARSLAAIDPFPAPAPSPLPPPPSPTPPPPPAPPQSAVAAPHLVNSAPQADPAGLEPPAGGEPTPSATELIELVRDWTRRLRDRESARLGRVVASTRGWFGRLPRPRTPPVVAATAPPIVVPKSPRPATVVVRMPSDQAELVVRGEIGRGNPDEWYGPRRVIHTKPLAAPSEFLIGAFWTDANGRQSTRTKTMQILPGRTYELNLETEVSTAIEVSPIPRSEM